MPILGRLTHQSLTLPSALHLLHYSDSSTSLTMNAEPPFSPLNSHPLPLSSNHRQLDPVFTSDFSTSRGKIPVSPGQVIPTKLAAPGTPVLCEFLSPLLEQASKSGGGLYSVPQHTLQQNLATVISALERLDAEALLDLELYPEESSQRNHAPGPTVRRG
jgi:hypothetical protein